MKKEPQDFHVSDANKCILLVQIGSVGNVIKNSVQLFFHPEARKKNLILSQFLL